ncbi:MAG: hypothetical protein IPL15_09110 [Comamonadaceae bacterium]|uniref:hypothetical protein n=1 Tax=Candidatus Skiveiella danica TaxID=3386177 RepID=UPI00390BE2AC|nr:hypothetical protein [Comamonadaceae bacterium]
MAEQHKPGCQQSQQVKVVGAPIQLTFHCCLIVHDQWTTHWSAPSRQIDEP